jgi:hypothetical protein
MGRYRDIDVSCLFPEYFSSIVEVSFIEKTTGIA